MHPLIEANREQLEALCRRHHVKQLDVFGSAAGDRFDERSSDVDMLVEFDADAQRGFGGDYFALKDDLEQLLDRQVDLVEAHVIDNPYFRESLERTRVQLYAA